ncbi:MAG: NADP-dependent oxidoreductase, partial [Actinomycetota bacterium]|nr:NADP-dependent oxidoreductase [Actinomycetota bacterium]
MPRAVNYVAFGGPENLGVGEVESMPMGPDSVQIEVAGAGINPVDYKVGYGYLAGAIETFFPVVPGWDVAGVVTAVGPAVTEFVPGDRVFGYARMDVIKHGTAAESVVLPVRLLARAPESINLVTAAAVPLVGLTAYQLVARMAIQPGEIVLVHNASGGVGQFAVQLARLAGARVIGSSSPRNHEHLRSLGVEAVSYGEALIEQVRALAPGGVDAVLDLVGGGALDASDVLLAPGGRVGSIADGEGAHARGGVYVFVRPSPADLTELSRLIDAGQLAVDLAATYGFDQASEAYQLL